MPINSNPEKQRYYSSGTTGGMIGGTSLGIGTYIPAPGQYIQQTSPPTNWTNFDNQSVNSKLQNIILVIRSYALMGKITNNQCEVIVNYLEGIIITLFKLGLS